MRKILLVILFLLSPYFLLAQDPADTYIIYNYKVEMTEEYSDRTRFRFTVLSDTTVVWRSNTMYATFVTDSIGIFPIKIPKNILAEFDDITIREDRVYMPEGCPSCYVMPRRTMTLTDFVFTEFQFESDPPGSRVYLVPMLIWLKKSSQTDWKKETVVTDLDLDPFLLTEGITDLDTYLPEENYKAVFVYEGQVEITDCKPIKARPVNKLSITFDES